MAAPRTPAKRRPARPPVSAPVALRWAESAPGPLEVPDAGVIVQPGGVFTASVEVAARLATDTHTRPHISEG